MKYLCTCLCIFLLFGSCLKDSCINTFTLYQPVLKTLTEVRTDMKNTAPVPLRATGKIYLYKQYIFLNESGRGIHVIDNANPAAPVNLSFIPIPGNIDIAIKDDYLYADSYSDLAVLSVSDIQNIHPVKFISNIFPGRSFYYSYNNTSPDSALVIVDYIAKDTALACNTYARVLTDGCINCSANNGTTLYAAASYTGTGGSMAAFTILDQYLYTVYYNKLQGFDLNNAADPQLKTTTDLSEIAETIYPFNQSLFIGTPSGMFMYNVTDPATPLPLGTFNHARSCDPVIADEHNAYVTLRSGNVCAGFSNQLDVLNIDNLLSPALTISYPLTNPHGLSKDGQWLFVCDGTDGLKVYDATNPSAITLQKHITGMETYDVIAQQHIALVVATDGIYQFDYSNANDIKQLSKITLLRN